MADQGTARALFRRMIDMGTEVEMCLKVIAFWTWLQSLGHHEIMRNICSRDNKLLIQMINEAKAVLSYLQPNSKASLSFNHLRFTAMLVRHLLLPPPSLIFSDKDYVLTCIADIHRDICCEFFRDTMLKGKAIIESGTKAEATSQFVQTVLNPSAKEWNPEIDRAPKESRCLFLTFSKGYALTEYQITRFFNRRYGPCVERVYVHLRKRRNREAPPLFGNVVFKASCVPAIIMSGKAEAKFWVDGKPLWCKRFEPKKSV